MATCKNCGATVSNPAKFCNVCGTSLNMVDSQKKADTDNRDVIDKTIDDWVIDLTKKGDTNFQNNSTIRAIRYYKQVLTIRPNDINVQTKLAKAQTNLKIKVKKRTKIAISVIAVIYVLAIIGSNIYDKISDYQYEQELKEQREADKIYKAKIEEEKKVVIERLNEIYAALSEGKDMNVYMSDELRTLESKALKLEILCNMPGMHRERDFWTDLQVYNKVSIKIIEFVNISLHEAEVMVEINDSKLEHIHKQNIKLIKRNNEWIVSDIIINIKDVIFNSRKEDAKSFIEAFGEKHNIYPYK